MFTKSEKTKIISTKRKLDKVNYLGGKCIKCGEDNIFKLCFHHRNPSEKELEFNSKRYSSLDEVKNELDKCDLLCLNCHREVHHYHEIENNRYRNIKKTILEWKGQLSCVKCGYDKCIAALEFHLYDKKFLISSIMKTNLYEIKSEIENELDKCDVLCSNCHKLEHSDYDFYLKNENLIINYGVRKMSKKLDRNLVKEMYLSGINQIDIAKKMNVSKSAVYVLIRKMNLPKRLVDTIDKNEIIRLYNSGLKKVDIARKLDVSKAYVGFIIKKNDLK